MGIIFLDNYTDERDDRYGEVHDGGVAVVLVWLAAGTEVFDSVDGGFGDPDGLFSDLFGRFEGNYALRSHGEAEVVCMLNIC